MARNQISWRNHFIELLVVIIGISIAFALEGWSERRKEKKLEINYLNSLRADLMKDKEDLRQVIDSTDVIVSFIGEIFRNVYTNQPSEVYQRHHVTSAYTTPYFNTQNGTYTTLINSGTINVIESFELKNALTELYNIRYREMQDMDDKIRNLVDDLIYPYMIRNIRFSPQRNGIEDASPLKTNEAINLLGSYYNFMGQSRKNIYGEVLAYCDSLIIMTERELNRLK